MTGATTTTCAKALWDRVLIDNVPALYVPALGRNIAFPSTVLLYGLGSMDRFFLEGRSQWRENVANAARWLLQNVRTEGYWDGCGVFRDRGNSYYSDNSCMNQGLALSFMTRVVKYHVLDDDLTHLLPPLMKKVADNMLLAVADGGTALYQGEDVFLCEDARCDGYVVLNGWIFGLFGLIDYCRVDSGSSCAESVARNIGHAKGDASGLSVAERLVALRQPWAYCVAILPQFAYQPHRCVVSSD